MTKIGATSYKQTKFGILAHDDVIKFEVKGTKKALQLLQDIADKNRPISPELIKQIHKDAYEDILEEDAGKFRTIQVTYSSKEALHFSKISEMILNLCDDTEYALKQLPNETDEEYVANLIRVLAQFQHRFVVIHPFVDYNGRMARLFTNYILMRLKLPIAEIRVENDADRKAYIDALQKADNGDYAPIEETVAESLVEGLEGIYHLSPNTAT